MKASEVGAERVSGVSVVSRASRVFAELAGVRGFPPIRQKKGEWMGHGEFFPV
jgi:hypothetical protein